MDNTKQVFTEDILTKQVLIIEDDELVSRTLSFRIKQFLPGAQVDLINNIELARIHLNNTSKKYDLVLVDHYLPDGLGLDFLKEGWFENMAVLVMSTNEAPEMPGASLQAGANYFLNKNQIESELFSPLLRGLIERNQLQKRLEENRVKRAKFEAIKIVVNQLKHEINNPLGAVLGATYLLRNYSVDSMNLKKTAELVELSSMRIKKFMDDLSLKISDSERYEKEILGGIETKDSICSES
jgi:response regulator of citrate/malate metabolism